MPMDVRGTLGVLVVAKKQNINDLYDEYLADEEYIQELETRLEDEEEYAKQMEELAKTLPFPEP